jgi:hypothetical protein
VFFVGAISPETIVAIEALVANPPQGSMSGLLAERPAPSALFRGISYNCEGAGDNGEDVLTICMASSTGAYVWRIVATMFGDL